MIWLKAIEAVYENNKTGECRSLNSQEAAKLKAYTERYLAKQAERQGLKK